MKFILMLSFVGIMQVSASVYSQNTKISFSMVDKSLKEVLNEIEKSTEFRFFYNDNFLDLNREVTVKADEQKVEEVLDNLLANSEVAYKVLDNNLIVITSKSMLQQQQRITGTITDASTGETLPGVNVFIEGTTIGAITDIDGKFSLQQPDPNSVLVFSFIGYLTQKVPFTGQTTVNVALASDVQKLDEVIVVGYGTQTKRSVTGSIQTVSSGDIKNIPVTQVTQSLQGKLAGVQINQGTGVPGSALNVRIRGAGSISAGSSPLYVIDGFPINGDMSNINPEEIETITVLKDAASTSLYGSRAANGVVMITTKRATSSKTEVGFNAYYGMQSLPEKGRPDMMNATEFAQFKKESYEDLGIAVPEAWQNPESYGVGNDWYDIMFRQAPIQDYSLSLSTKTDKMSVSAIGGYFNQAGILINSGYSRYSLRINSDFKVNDKVTIGFNLAPTYSTNFTPSSDGSFIGGGLLANALQTWPMVPYINADGTLPLYGYIPGLGTFTTANFYRAAQEIKTTSNNLRLLSNAFVQYSPIKGLVLKSSLNIQLGNTGSKFFNPSTSSTSFSTAPPVTATGRYNSGQGISWLSESTATYAKTFGDHNFEILGGYTTQKSTDTSLGITVTNFPDDRISTATSATVRTASTSEISEWSMVSYLARLTYDYKGKYLVTASVRRDGSSRFGANNKWGNFPSVSLGWIASEESFFPKNDVLTFMKLRGSYGLTGNNNIGNYASYASVNLGQNAIFGSTIAAGSAVANLSNPMLGWETTSQLDLGADFGLWNNRISLNYDFYVKNTYDMLYSFSIPPSSGFSSYLGNSGELKFWGHELALTSRNTVGKFKWTSNVNVTFGDNKVVSLAPGITAIISGGHISKVGERIGLFYGLIQDGVYVDQADYDASPKAAQSAVGTIKFRDVNGDGIILNSSELANGDQTVIGDPTPKYLFGITNTFEYKNFDLSIVASGSVGNDIANRFEQGTTNLDGPFNILKEVKYRWRSPENPGLGKYGTTTKATGMERDWFNSRFIKKGDYLTIKNVTLGYNLPVNKIKFMTRLRVYASVQQLYVFTKYPGNNPEVSSSANALTLGDDNTSYPVARTFTFGVNMGF